jgi:hypothetical protein
MCHDHGALKEVESSLNHCVDVLDRYSTCEEGLFIRNEKTKPCKTQKTETLSVSTSMSSLSPVCIHFGEEKIREQGAER